MNAPRSRARTALVACIALACAAVLSACGAKVDTVITLNDGPAGARVITLTLSASDLSSNVTGGTAALDASIAKHKPAELDYNGISPTADGVVATFTVSFASADDYKKKIAAILTASGSTTAPEIDIATENSLFVQGAVLHENFSSIDLLGWLPDGLVADSVVSAGNKSNVLESGSTTVVRGGVSTDAGSDARFDAMQDNGITALSVRTTVQDDGTYQRQIDYSMGATAYATNSAGFDAFFADATPTGGKLTPSTDAAAGTVGWTLVFDAKDPAEVATRTDQALTSDSTSFEVTTEPAPDNAAVLVTTIVDSIDCSAICSPDADPVPDTLLAPRGWTAIAGADADDGTGGDGLAVTHEANGEPIALEHAIPFASVEVATVLGFDHSIDQTLTFVATNANVALAGDAFTSMLKPSASVGTLTTTKEGDTTHYVVHIHGDTPAQYSTRISSFVPGARVDISENAAHGFFHADYTMTSTLDLASTLARNGVTKGISYSTTVPFAQHVVAERSALGAGGKADGREATWKGGSTVAVTVEGLPVSALVFWGVVMFLVLVTAGAALLFRRRIAALIARVRAERTRRTLALPPVPAALAPPASAPVWTSSTPPAAPTAPAYAGPEHAGLEHAGATREFSEADLI